MIIIDGKEYRTLEEQVIWLTDNHTAGTYSGSDWSTLTIDGVTKSIPTGGGGESKSITDIIVAKPEDGEVSYSSSDGVVVETTATVQYDDSSEEEISFSYYIPLVAGSNVTMTEDNGLVTIASSGGGSEPSAYIKSVSIDGNTITFTKKDDSTQTYTPDVGVTSVNGSTGAITGIATTAQVNAKSTVTGTVSSGNWTSLTVDGTTASIPSGGSGVTSFNDLTDRPSYNGSTMTSSTSIPEVKTSTWDAKQDAISDLSSIRSNASNGATAYSNLGNGAYTVAKSVPANAVFTDTTYAFEAPLDESGGSVSLSTSTGLTYDGVGLAVDTDVIQTKISSTNKVAASNISGLATVATSGSYADLSNKPTINTYTAGEGIDIQNNEISVSLEGDGGLEFAEDTDALQVDFTAVQQKLTSGTNIKTITVGSTATSLLGSGTITGLQAQMSVEVLGSSDT